MRQATLKRAAPETVAAQMAVTRLVLSDFRSYERLALALDSRPVVLTGPNGAGKTNMLEAVSFLAPGRGLRRARLAEVDRAGGGPWRVAATVMSPDGPVEIGTGRDADDTGRDRRLVRIDGAPARAQVDLAERLVCLWLTPAMDRLFADGPGGRRRFLDRVVFGFDAAHARRLNAYEHALRERARVLRDGRRDPAWLAGLEETMARQGIAVAAARREAVARLNGACAEAHGPFPGAELRLVGRTDDWLAGGPAVEAEDRLRRALAWSRAEDAEAGGAVEGPHRSDLTVRHLGRGLPAAACSTGEQKALLIAVVLAVTRLMGDVRGAAPIVLLDEVAAHLDGERRAALIDEVIGLGAQAWLTGTDEALFAPFGDRARFFHVEEAVVTARDG